MIYLISGGAKNGKSTYAEDCARKLSKEHGTKLYYVATMIPHDSEDEARIARHIKSRAGKGFETIEKGRNLLEIFAGQGDGFCGTLKQGDGTFLVDATTSLLSNEMFREDGTVDLEAGPRLERELTEFAKLAKDVVFVSDYIYSDARRFDELTEAYRKALAGIDRAIAKVADHVIEVSFSTITEFKSQD